MPILGRLGPLGVMEPRIVTLGGKCGNPAWPWAVEEPRLKLECAGESS
jgi:hypothetical protein